MTERVHDMLVFDFDGVMANSIHESFVTALNTHWRLLGGRGLPLDGPIEPPQAIFDFERAHEDLFRGFREVMPLGNRAEDYLVMLRSLVDAQGPIHSQEAFEARKRDMDAAMLHRFHDAFYAARRKLQDDDPETWMALVPPFEPVVEAVGGLSERFILGIATAKDRASVHLQLEHYGLLPLFEDRVLDKDFARKKRQHLTAFHERFGVPFERMHFIDDKVSHLLDVAELGVHGYLALWGFNGQRERAIARQNGFHLLELADLKDLGG